MSLVDFVSSMSVAEISTTSAVSMNTLQRETGHLMLTGAGGITVTIDAPTAGTAANGRRVQALITNNSAGTCTIACTNGFAQGGDSISLTTGVSVWLVATKAGAPSSDGYIWATLYDSSGAGASAEFIRDTIDAWIAAGSHTNVTITADDPGNSVSFVVDGGYTAEQISDMVGAMFTGNTETGVTVTYQDGDNTIDVVVTYGTTAATACVGNDTRLLSAENYGDFAVALTAKAVLADADLVAVSDSADNDDAKKSTVAELRTALLAADPLGTKIAALAAKATPIDTDIFLVTDTADTNDCKKSTLAQLRAVLLAKDPLGSVINGLDAKATPIGLDMLVIADSADTNDAKKVTFTAAKAAMGVANVAAFTPTIALSGGAAATVTAEVYRQKTSYDWCDWVVDIAGTDGGGATTLTLDFPAALVPTDVNMLVPVKAQVSVNGAAYANVVGTLDCAAAAGADRQLVVATGTLTDDQAFRIIVSGGHEITPA